MYKCTCNKEFDNKKSLIGHQGRCQIHSEWINSILTPLFLFTEYIIKKQSTPDISNATGIGIATIHRRLQSLGISRTVKESCKIESKTLKRQKTSLKKYGSPHNFCKEHPSRIKWEKRLKEKEGIINVFQRKDVKKKIKNTLLKKYNVESSGKITTSRGKNSYSAIHKEIVKKLIKIGIKVGIEKKIPKNNGYYYSFDIIIENTNLLIEVNGDYWHGNPEIYHPEDIIMKNSSAEIMVKEVWKKDKEKIIAAEQLGYKIIVIWENDWKNNLQKELDKVQNEIKNCKNRKN